MPYDKISDPPKNETYHSVGSGDRASAVKFLRQIADCIEKGIVIAPLKVEWKTTGFMYTETRPEGAPEPENVIRG